MPDTSPILIVGAGISGLLLAQHLHTRNIAFRVFERDADLQTRGVGWGLTLHWSLPALRSLLPDDLVKRLPEAYVDRAAVEEGLSSTFPFFDLSTGELKAATPKAGEADRIRVTREKLREILATDISIEWNKALVGISSDSNSVTASFEDGTSATGRLLVACDGSQSPSRRVLFPDNWKTHEIPVRMIGVKLNLSAQQMQPMRELDPFFLQGTSSKDNSFIYISVLDAPDNHDEDHPYICQVCVSWPYRPGFLGTSSPIDIPETKEDQLSFIRKLSSNWSEPFRTLVQNIPEDAEVKGLVPQDFPPPIGLRSTGRAVLMGDAIHAMAMYRGEGANHAILDVLDFTERLIPILKGNDNFDGIRKALDEYEDAVVKRSRPGVLASRRACLDAHEWERIGSQSPLLTRRTPHLDFTEE